MNGIPSGLRAGAAAAGLLLAGPAAAQPVAGPAAAQPVRVRYVAPERFTDAETRFGSGPSLATTLSGMTRILEQLGQARLRPGESLELSVLDIDLAGIDRPGFGAPTGARIVTDATPPRLRLAYVLRRSRKVVRRGEETITDINFLLASNPRFSSGSLYYERALLRDWFAKRFASP
ncbi:hypothetical protein OPKNFCMD_4004 [Methylobacterium crusticola]|uniref:DUF3016 domain-containing protein n=1 Tax=Methylobacterium crusticola TaxID=1697972 RepID=A0ABQ4R1T5_9HYPH|nr:DUF3016 domain-containing protein [Methylobacterium crusticola]GJD51251.1 hypothetical protein OPKNFCMD_4004 [Methylobacterium crusticola]